MGDEGRRELDRAFDCLEEEAPDRVSRAIRWLRDPKARKVRIPVGVLFLIGGLLWFLPVVGLELIPIGLLLIAQDVPFLRKPVARAMLWLEGRLPLVALAVILARDILLLGGYKLVVPRGYDFEVTTVGKLATWVLYASLVFVMVTRPDANWPLWLFWAGVALAVVAGVQYVLKAAREVRR